jgi:hypothetical protein
MKFINRLRYLWSAPAEIDALIKAEQEKLEQERIEANKDRLHLCYRHRQEETHAHYDEKNCDYCSLERELDHYKLYYENYIKRQREK